MIKVELSNNEIDMLIDVCKNIQSKKWNVNNKRVSGDSDLDVWITGIKGEYAFAKTYDLQLNTEAMAHGDGGTDFTVNNKTVDVKTRTRKGGDLLLFRKDCADYFVLTIVDGNKVDMIGKIRGDVAKSDKYYTKNFYGKGERWVVPQSDLIPLKIPK